MPSAAGIERVKNDTTRNIRRKKEQVTYPLMQAASFEQGEEHSRAVTEGKERTRRAKEEE